MIRSMSVSRRISKAAVKNGKRESAAVIAARLELKALYVAHSREELRPEDGGLARVYDTEYAAGRAVVLECLINRVRKLVVQSSSAEPGKFEVRLVTGEGMFVLKRGTREEVDRELEVMIERAKAAGQVAEASGG